MYAIANPCRFSSVNLKRKYILRMFIAENFRSGVAVETAQLTNTSVGFYAYITEKSHTKKRYVFSWQGVRRHLTPLVWLRHCPKATEFGEKTQDNGITPFKVIQGHRFWYQSKAHMRLPIGATNLYPISCPVSKLLQIIDQICAFDRG